MSGFCLKTKTVKLFKRLRGYNFAEKKQKGIDVITAKYKKIREDINKDAAGLVLAREAREAREAMEAMKAVDTTTTHQMKGQKRCKQRRDASVRSNGRPRHSRTSTR